MEEYERLASDVSINVLSAISALIPVINQLLMNL